MGLEGEPWARLAGRASVREERVDAAARELERLTRPEERLHTQVGMAKENGRRCLSAHGTWAVVACSAEASLASSLQSPLKSPKTRSSGLAHGSQLVNRRRDPLATKWAAELRSGAAA